MEEYLIKPWDTRQEAETGQLPADWDMQVPPEIDALAEAVMRQYDMTVSSRTLITSKPDKGGAIWRIETNKGPRSLKLLHRAPERSLFSVGLQDYVVKQGARVPALIPAKDGKLFVEKGGKLWIVTDWISLTPAAKVDLTGAQELCYGLGEFHRHTKGYIPPVGAKNSSRLYRWPNYYQKIAKKIGWMRETAAAYRDTAASAGILAVVNQYEDQARNALARLEQSAYYRMVAMGEPYWGLVHQDYGWSNGQNGPGGLWVIDLDGVSYDLPFRDLRKLITSTMDDMGVWDLTWIRGMIDAYHQAHPLDAESYEVLLIDMAMPNEFYKHLKEMFFDPVTFLNMEASAILQRVVATDQTKDQALAELARDKAKYKPGAYDAAAVPGKTESAAQRSDAEEKRWTLAEKEQPLLASNAGEEKEKVQKRVPLSPQNAADSPTAKKGKQTTVQKSAASQPAAKKEKQTTIQKPAAAFPVDELSIVSPANRDPAEKTEMGREERERRERGLPEQQTNVIDLVPYLRRQRRSGSKTRKRLSGSKKTRKLPVRQPKKAGSAAKPGNRTTNNPATRRVRKAAAPAKEKRLAVQETTKSAKPRKSAAAEKRASRSASSPQRLAYSRVPAPRHKTNRNAARKPSAKRGKKKSGGLR